VSIRTNDDKVQSFVGELLYLGFDLPKTDGVNSLLDSSAVALPEIDHKIIIPPYTA